MKKAGNRSHNRQSKKRASEGSSCEHCQKLCHTKDRCWQLHPELNSFKKKDKYSEGSFDKERAKTNEGKPHKLFLVSKSVYRSAQGSRRRDDWIFDTGATTHSINDLKHLISKQSEDQRKQGVFRKQGRKAAQRAENREARAGPSTTTHTAFIATIQHPEPDDISVPNIYKEAIISPQARDWLKAMRSELENLEVNNT